MSTVAFAELVARQSGVVSVAQAVATGVPQRTVQRWTRTWRRLHPGVYLVAGHRLTPEGRLRAALLWAGPEAVLTGQAAAHWHGPPAPTPAVVEVTVPVPRKPRAQPRVEIRRRELHRVDLSVVRGLRVAAAPLAALETAVVLDEGSVFLDRVLQRHVQFPELYRCFCRNIGRYGSSEAGRLITAAADRADSAAERLLIQLMRHAGITGWRVGVSFGAYTIDVAFGEGQGGD